MAKKIISFILSVMIISVYCPAFAATVSSGTCGADGSNLTWTLSSKGVLTISGQGAMADYYSITNVPPWYSHRQGGYITKIVVNNGVTRIGNYCFNFCINTTSVSLPSTLKEIGDNAFYDCYALTGITLNAGLESIGGFAFHGCTKLESLTIPETVSNIGKRIGNYFKTVNVNANNQTYKSTDGVLFSKDGTELIFFPPKYTTSDYTIPTGTEKLNEASFYGAEVESIYMPDTVSEVGWDVFSHCANLTSIRLSENLKALKGQSFSYCTSLKELYIPNSVKSMTATNNYWEFPGCRDLKITVDNVKGGIINGEGQFASSSIASVTYLRELYVSEIDDCVFGEKPEPVVIERTADSHAYIKTLIKDTDYYTRYSYADRIGEATVTIIFFKAGSDYHDVEDIVKAYTILNPELEISSVDDQVYIGASVHPTVTIKNKTTNATLKSGTDYKYSYLNNSGVGTGTITITYLNNYANYSGSATSVDFKITGDMSRAVIAASDSNLIYNGKTITPSLTVTYFGKTLTQGVDYSASYENNINAGKASVRIQGNNLYAGNKTLDFTIKPKPCSNLQIAPISDAVFTGKAMTPAVVIRDADIN